MSEQPGTIETIARHLALAVQPLRAAVTDREAFKRFMYRMGWRVESLPPAYASLGALVDETSTTLAAIESSPGTADLSAVLDLLAKVRALYQGIAGLTDAPAGVDATAFLAEIRERLFEILLVDYLAAALPWLYEGLITVGIIAVEANAQSIDRPPYVRSSLRFDRVRDLIADPTSVPRFVYGWGEDDLDTATLFSHLRELLEHTGALVSFGSAPTDLVEGYMGGGASRTSLKLTILQTTVADTPVEVAFILLPLPAEDEHKPGLILQPVVPPGLGVDYDFGGGLQLRIRPTADLSALFGVVIRPGDLSARYPFAPGELPAVGFGVALEYKPDSTTLLLGRPSATRLVMQGVSVTLDLDRHEGGLELRLGLSLNGLTFVLAVQEQDSFLREVIGDEDATIPLPLTIQWSSRTGVAFAGGAGLELSQVVDVRVEPLAVQELRLALRITLASGRPPDLIADIGVSIGGRIGPVAFSVENVGLRLTIVFQDGNAASFDIAVGVKPPDGIGLAIDAQAVLAGGFLRFDSQQEAYSGMLELQIAERIAVKAFWLLTTRMPDGGKGYSLVVIIFAEGFAPIQLGYGFTLTGIGGLLAINRTFSEDALRAGLKNHTLDSVLFPQDPLRNAPQIISSLNTVFPPATGHHLFGPMAQISWGPQPLITADLGLVLEFGAQLRLLMLGQVVAILPSRENEQMRLQMDAVGVFDFDQGTAALDATLYDSRLLKRFPLTGDMAMRLQWEGSPNFALAVGGLHPAFNPPPNFPKLERIALNLSRGDNPRLRCEAYFVLTSNTVQFGAHAELYAAAAGFSLQGEIGFDVLIQLDPFHFLADFYAQVQLKRGSTNLFKIRVEGALAGPRPLHIKGKATFEILWWDVTIRFDKTLVGGEAPPLPEPVDVLPLLREALGHPGSWRSQLPAGQRPMVTLHATPGTATDVSLHPLGTLTVTQSVVPLNLEISRFGSAVPAGVRSFTISSASLGGQNLTSQPVTDFFAPAQFFEMSDDEKLSRPSFEPLAAGLSIGSDAFTFSANDGLEADIAYETITVGQETNESRRSESNDLYKLSQDQLRQQARFGAAGASALRRTGKAKYHNPARVGPKLVKEGWSIVETASLAEQPMPGLEAGTPVTYSEAVQALRIMQQENPAKAGSLKIIRLSELR